MNNITKNLQWKIILFPIILIILTASTITIYEVNSVQSSLTEKIEKKTHEYVESHKEDVRKTVLMVKETIDFHRDRYEKNKLPYSLSELQNLIIQRYSKITKDDEYLFIYKIHNIQGGKDFATMILNQNKPSLAGQKISDDYIDARGKAFRKEFLELIRKDGEGFVEYWYKKPNHDDAYKKMSYFYYDKEWNWVIAQGFYFETLKQQLEFYKKEVKKEIQKKITTTITMTVILSSIAAFISILLSKRIITLINYYISVIQNNEKKFIRRLERFIDTQDNIVILTDGEILNFVNKKFFTFLGFKDLAAFNNKHKCICELFIENNRFFHLGKVPQGENWLDIIKKLPQSQQIVSMMGDDFVVHAFSVTINRFDKNFSIISFSDISQTMLEHIQLQEKTIHDKLTNAFNREYFEQNCKHLISEYSQDNYKFALAILDIDFFKTVNDTYGHDIGDLVLKQFVQTIQKYSRKNDILIRWGGEEFILLLKISSIRDLYKALEHIRKVVEMQSFEKVGQKTCSIGATIYQPDESVEDTVKRADEALYSAKETGRNKVVIYE